MEALAPPQQMSTTSTLEGMSFVEQTAVQVYQPSPNPHAFSPSHTPFAYHPNGEQAALSCSKTPEIWDLTSATKLCALTRHKEPIRKLLFSPSGKSLLVLSYTKATLWETSTWTQLIEQTSTARSNNGICGCFDRDETRLFIGSNEEVTIWDLATKQVIKQLAYRQRIRTLAISPIDSFILTGHRLSDSTHCPQAQLRNYTSGQNLLEIDGHNRTMYLYASFSPDGQRVLILSCRLAFGCVSVWDLKTNAEQFRLKGEDSKRQNKARFNPTGELIISRTCEFWAKIQVWNGSTGALLHQLKMGPSTRLWSSPYPDYIAATCAGAVEIRHFSMGKPVCIPYLPNLACASELVFRPDGQQLAFCDTRGFMRLWNLRKTSSDNSPSEREETEER